jgi:hypothetical protein
MNCLSFLRDQNLTPVDSWLSDGKTTSAVDGIQEAIGHEFELVKKCDLPYVIPEASRRYQYYIPECTVWRRIHVHAEHASPKTKF